jgi:hypothetical protein
MQKKYQIFVSSTFRDLADERQDAIRSILDLGHIPAGMELFPAADTEQLTYIKKVIDECDYYVLIIGGRYGSLDAEGVSFTEREYDYAVETGKTVLAFVHGDAASIPLGKSDTAPRLASSLEEFRAKVMQGRLVREWSSREQLESLVVKSIVRAVSDLPAVGWIRGNVAASDELLNQINNFRTENEKLRQRNAALEASLKPKLDGLAAIDASVKLRFVHSYYYNQKTNYDYQSFDFTWREIFKAVATRITTPTSTGLISSFLFKHMKENRGTQKSYSLTDDAAATVKNQLAGLGLLNVYIAKTVKDGTLHEFMQVTDLGKSELQEMLAIRAAAEVPVS